MAAAASVPPREVALLRRGQMLLAAGIGWNTAEGVIAIGAGASAGSIALVGFGVDSAIEVTSSFAAVWLLARFKDADRREGRERVARRVIGVCFLALAGYVAWDALTSLSRRQAPAVSLIGIVLAALSVVLMPLLVRAKTRLARQLHSHALEAESRQTLLCACLSAILLVGLGLNAWLGWWWADPSAGLAMVPLIVREGLDALRGQPCCAG